MRRVRFVGLDVHAETIAVAIAEGGGDREVRCFGVISNCAEAIRKFIRKLGSPEDLRVCYEAGPCGYTVYWQLTQLGVACEVVAPTLIPIRAGDRVKTDRRDAEKLARLYRSGELTAVWVPDAACEALRDLVRAREVAGQDRLRARHRLSKFLLRHGFRPPPKTKAWGSGYEIWLRSLRFDLQALQATFTDYRHEVEHSDERIRRLDQVIGEAISQAPEAMQHVIAALQSLRGVAQIAAVTLVTEVGKFSRFSSPRELMAYSGLVPREHSSGGQVSRGAITKSGNAHLRRILIQSAWCNRLSPNRGYVLKKRQEKVSREILEISWKAQHRLSTRGRHLRGRGKEPGKVVTAVAREMLGFIWAVAVQAEKEWEASRPRSRFQKAA